MSSVALVGSGGAGGGGDATAANQVLEITELEGISNTVDMLLQSQSYALQLDDSAPPITYIGQALPGTLTEEALWRIKKVDETTGLVITWAEGTSDFNQVWNDRASLSYS